MPSAVSERATARASACARTPLTCSSRSAQHCVPAGTQARAQLRSLVLVRELPERRLLHRLHNRPFPRDLIALAAAVSIDVVERTHRAQLRPRRRPRQRQAAAARELACARRGAGERVPARACAPATVRGAPVRQPSSARGGASSWRSSRSQGDVRPSARTGTGTKAPKWGGASGVRLSLVRWGTRRVALPWGVWRR